MKITDRLLEKTKLIRYIKLVLAATIILLQANYLSGCGVASEERNFFAMDTYMTIVCYGDDAKEAVDEAVDRINELDNLFSVGKDTSEVSIINNEKTLIASDEMIDVISRSIDIYKKTNGAFDITVKPLVDLWGFATGELYVPSKDEINRYLDVTGIDDIYIEETASKIDIGTNQKVDLGGIAKGYATDEVKKILDKHDIKSAYMSLGGNVYCYNRKIDGSKWTIGITNQTTNSQNTCFATVEVVDRAVITSGGYQRYLIDEATNEKYIHILDPYTGYPSKSDILSVTIISTDATLSDALSTACYVMGKDNMIEYWKDSLDNFDFVIYTEDDKVYASYGLVDAINSDMDIIFVNK